MHRTPFLSCFYHCSTKVLIPFALRTCLRASPQTGQVHLSFVSVLPPHKLILTPLVLVCLSADWAGALVLFNSFLFVVVFRLASCLTIDCLASCFLGFFLVCFPSPGGVLGPVSCGLLLRPALVVPLCPLSCGPCVFCLVFVCGVAGFCGLFLPALRYSPLGDPDPPSGRR